jgi:hypothetical protein
MERGLLWLPLLGVFIWLAWAGWNEYQKLEAYKRWAIAFERAKYDIYAVLGQQGDRLVWGRPTRQGPVDIQEIALSTLQQVVLYGADEPLPVTAPVPKGCDIALALQLADGDRVWIPFTDIELATAWQNQLQTEPKSLQSTPNP